MTITEKIKFIKANRVPGTLDVARELAKHQWDVIVHLLEEKSETFAAYSELEEKYDTLADYVYQKMAETLAPDSPKN